MGHPHLLVQWIFIHNQFIVHSKISCHNSSCSLKPCPRLCSPPNPSSSPLRQCSTPNPSSNPLRQCSTPNPSSNPLCQCSTPPSSQPRNSTMLTRHGTEKFPSISTERCFSFKIHQRTPLSCTWGLNRFSFCPGVRFHQSGQMCPQCCTKTRTVSLSELSCHVIARVTWFCIQYCMW